VLKDENGVRQYLGGHLDSLRDCVETGFYRYFKLPDDVLNDMIPRARAIIIHTFIIREAERRFSGISGIQLLNARQLFLINFGEVQVRFKKINRRLQSRNILTSQTIAYACQETLPGIPPAVNLVAGYHPDKFHTDIESIAIVCPNGTRYHWFIPLDSTLKSAVPLLREKEDGGTERKLPSVKEGIEHERDGSKDV